MEKLENVLAGLAYYKVGYNLEYTENKIYLTFESVNFGKLTIIFDENEFIKSVSNDYFTGNVGCVSFFMKKMKIYTGKMKITVTLANWYFIDSTSYKISAIK